MDDPLQYLFIIIVIWLILYILLEFKIISDKRNEVNKVFFELDELFYKRLLTLSKMLDIVKIFDRNQFDELSSSLYDYLNNYKEFEINSKIKLNEKLDVEIKKILLVSKVYPEILENNKYIKMEKQLIRFNRRIFKLQIKYNKIVKVFFERKKIFPSNIFCIVFKFYHFDYFNINN